MSLIYKYKVEFVFWRQRNLCLVILKVRADAVWASDNNIVPVGFSTPLVGGDVASYFVYCRILRIITNKIVLKNACPLEIEQLVKPGRSLVPDYSRRGYHKHSFSAPCDWLPGLLDDLCEDGLVETDDDKTVAHLRA